MAEDAGLENADYVSCNGSKRRKLDEGDEPVKPSCVLHLRGLPGDVTEAEVAALGQPFGTVNDVILTRNKNQALLEMGDLPSAQMMVEYYSKQLLYVRTSPVFVQYSNHAQLKLEADGQSLSSDCSRCILHVIVDNMVYPINVDMLYHVFHTSGKILRIVTFNKNNSFQALIQFSDNAEAHKAKLTLNGHNIFNGCCKLHIEYSKLQNLSVKYNNDKSRDYTNKHLPTDGSPSPAAAITQYDRQHIPNAYENLGMAAGSVYPQRALAETMMPMVGCLPTPALVHGQPTAYPSNALPANVPCFGGSPVILVSNLNENKVTPQALFTLFGVYGDVIRVKVLFNKKSKALVQFKDAAHAQLALTHLDYVKLWGKQLELSLSKFRTVQMPKDDQPDSHLTQDYTMSQWHRFRNVPPNGSGGRARAHVVSPSDTLHLSNIPKCVTEQQLRDLFGRCGTVVDFKFFEVTNVIPDRRMALIQLSSVEEAVEALVDLHNADFDGTSRRLCVSFTKSVINHSSSATSM